MPFNPIIQIEVVYFKKLFTYYQLHKLLEGARHLPVICKKKKKKDPPSWVELSFLVDLDFPMLNRCTIPLLFILYE